MSIIVNHGVHVGHFNMHSYCSIGVCQYADWQKHRNAQGVHLSIKLINYYSGIEEHNQRNNYTPASLNFNTQLPCLKE